MDLNEAIKVHSEWKMKLRGAISAQTILDAANISKDNCCALGKWLHGESRAKFGTLPSHADCIRTHAAFHKEAGKVASAINSRKYVEAEQMLASGSAYAVASNAVVIAIGKLKHDAKL
jgi:hypothetical protein